MKNLIYALVILTGVGTVKGQALYESLTLLNPAGVTILYSESFEGTGYENPSSETQLGFDEDDTASATAGSQNLKALTPVTGYAFPNAGWTPQAVITLKFSFKVSATSADSQIIQIDSAADGSARGYVWIQNGGAVRIYGNGAGSVDATTTDTVSAGTQYYCQAKWNKTTGVYSVEFNTSNTFTGSGNKFVSDTDGDTGTTIGGLRYYSTGATITTSFDQVIATTP